MSNGPWIKTELTRLSGVVNPEGGIDFDRSGIVEESEIPKDLDGNGALDFPEWSQFVREHADAIQSSPTFGSSLFKWVKLKETDSGLSPDNPLHDILSIERHKVSSREIGKAYEKVSQVLQLVKAELEKNPSLTPQEKVELVRSKILESGIHFGDAKSELLSKSLETQDCDMSIFILLGVGHELHWPIQLERAYGHILARWKDDQNEFFIDFVNTNPGESVDLDFYSRAFSVFPDLIEKGIYLTPLTPQQIKASAIGNVGLEYLNAGNPRRAVQWLKKAVELDPTHVLAYNNLGAAYWELHENSKAIRYFDLALALDPQNGKILNSRGEVYYEEENLPKAKRDFEAAHNYQPLNEAVLINLIKIYIEEGNAEQARRTFRKAYAVNPKNITLYVELGTWQMERKQYVAARNAFDKALEIDRHHFVAYLERGNVNIQLGQFEAGIRDFQRAIQLNPNSLLSYSMLALSYKTQKEYRKAEMVYQRMLKVADSHNNTKKKSEIYFSLAEVAYAQKEYSRAVGYCREAIRSNPADSEKVTALQRQIEKDLQADFIK